MATLLSAMLFLLQTYCGNYLYNEGGKDEKINLMKQYTFTS